MNKTIFNLIFILLLGFVSASYDCAAIDLQTYWVLWAIIGLMIGIAVAVIAYLLGKLLLEHRESGWIFGRFSRFPLATDVWAKEQIAHIIISALLIVFAVGLLQFACSDTLASIFDVSASNMFEGAQDYLDDQADLAYKSMTAFRYNMGVAEIRSSQSRWESRAEFGIFGGGQGTSYSPHSGQRSYVSIFNIGMNAGTMYLLNIYFMYYVMNYIFYGLAFMFPLGILLRSFPFVKNIGNALIALSFGLFIFFPFMLMFNDATWGEYIEVNKPSTYGFNSELDTNINYYTIEEQDPATRNPWYLADKEYSPSQDSLPALGPLAKLSAQSFIGTVFLPAINWIIIIVLIKEISKLLGQEIDIRRLARMV